MASKADIADVKDTLDNFHIMFPKFNPDKSDCETWLKWLRDNHNVALGCGYAGAWEQAKKLVDRRMSLFTQKPVIHSRIAHNALHITGERPSTSSKVVSIERAATGGGWYRLEDEDGISVLAESKNPDELRSWAERNGYTVFNSKRTARNSSHDSVYLDLMANPLRQDKFKAARRMGLTIAQAQKVVDIIQKWQTQSAKDEEKLGGSGDYNDLMALWKRNAEKCRTEVEAAIKNSISFNSRAYNQLNPVATNAIVYSASLKKASHLKEGATVKVKGMPGKFQVFHRFLVGMVDYDDYSSSARFEYLLAPYNKDGNTLFQPEDLVINSCNSIVRNALTYKAKNAGGVSFDGAMLCKKEPDGWFTVKQIVVGKPESVFPVLGKFKTRDEAERFMATNAVVVVANSVVYPGKKMVITKDDKSGLYNAMGAHFSARGVKKEQIVSLINDALDSLKESVNDLENAKRELKGN